MKIKQILEARYTGDIDKISVHQVYQVYKEHNTGSYFSVAAPPGGTRFIDPAIHAKQRYITNTDELYTQLAFISSKMSQEELKRWVQDYAKQHQLPYTHIINRGTAKVILQFKRPQRKLREAKYTSGKPLTIEKVSKIYKRYDNTREAWQRLGLKEKGDLWITTSSLTTTPVLHFETRGLSEHSVRKIVKRFLVKNNIPYNYVHSTITRVSPAGPPYVSVVATYDPDRV